MIQRKKRLVTDSDVDVSRKESSQLQLTHEKKNIWFFKFRLINLSQNSKTNWSEKDFKKHNKNKRGLHSTGSFLEVSCRLWLAVVLITWPHNLSWRYEDPPADIQRTLSRSSHTLTQRMHVWYQTCWWKKRSSMTSASCSSSSSSSSPTAVLNTVLLTATSCKDRDTSEQSPCCPLLATLRGSDTISSHLSSWAQQKHFNVLAAAPRALVLPDQVSRRVGAHARIRRPDLTESTHTLRMSGWQRLIFPH